MQHRHSVKESMSVELTLHSRNAGADPERKVLERQFLNRLGTSLLTTLATLQPIVLRLIEFGATRQSLEALAVAKGYQKAYVRSLISAILVRRGGRQRKSGAGPKTSELAKLILAFAREKAGRQAYKYLTSAAHAARKEDQAALAADDASLVTQIPVRLSYLK